MAEGFTELTMEDRCEMCGAGPNSPCRTCGHNAEVIRLIMEPLPHNTRERIDGWYCGHCADSLWYSGRDSPSKTAWKLVEPTTFKAILASKKRTANAAERRVAALIHAIGSAGDTDHEDIR